jgi:hypothetical protein
MDKEVQAASASEELETPEPSTETASSEEPLGTEKAEPELKEEGEPTVDTAGQELGESEREVEADRN